VEIEEWDEEQKVINDHEIDKASMETEKEIEMEIIT
jgi:hypothetical protein